jgi:hypothetical protein
MVAVSAALEDERTDPDAPRTFAPVERVAVPVLVTAWAAANEAAEPGTVRSAMPVEPEPPVDARFIAALRAAEPEDKVGSFAVTKTPVVRETDPDDREEPAAAKVFGAVMSATPVEVTDPTATRAFAPVDRVAAEASKTAPSAENLMAEVMAAVPVEVETPGAGPKPEDTGTVRSAVPVEVEAPDATRSFGMVRSATPEEETKPAAHPPVPFTAPTK